MSERYLDSFHLHYIVKIKVVSQTKFKGASIWTNLVSLMSRTLSRYCLQQAQNATGEKADAR